MLIHYNITRFAMGIKGYRKQHWSYLVICYPWRWWWWSLYLYIHNTHVWSPKGWQRRFRYFSATLTFYKNDLDVKNTADVTGCKPIAIWLWSISGGDAVNPLVAFYNIHGRKREVVFFCSVPDTTRDYLFIITFIDFGGVSWPIIQYKLLELHYCCSRVVSGTEEKNSTCPFLS
jgi:hypothetical protein